MGCVVRTLSNVRSPISGLLELPNHSEAEAVRNLSCMCGDFRWLLFFQARVYGGSLGIRCSGGWGGVVGEGLKNEQMKWQEQSRLQCLLTVGD